MIIIAGCRQASVLDQDVKITKDNIGKKVDDALDQLGVGLMYRICSIDDFASPMHVE